jgi:hypothetical protein
MLGQEVLAFEKRVDTWLQQQQQPELTSRAGTVTQAPVNTARDLPREVIDLEVSELYLSLISCYLRF